jgi:predicted small metal-binding protein
MRPSRHVVGAMAYTGQCSEPECEFDTHGENEQQLLAELREHEQEEHGNVPDEDAIRERIRERD